MYRISKTFFLRRKFLSLIAVLLLWDASPADLPDAVEVTVKETVAVSEPVSPLLLSGVIELAVGRTDNILAEMLFDRGFEIPDSLTFNSGWCVLGKPKPEMEDWWHSGYEQNRWYLKKQPGDTTSAMKKVSGTWPIAPNGKFYLSLHNKSKTDPICLAQDGVYIRSGMTYDFSGLLCDGTMFSAAPNTAKPVTVEVFLFPEKKFDAPPVSSAKIDVDATTPRRFSVTLPVGTYTGRATFALQIGPGQRLVCDMLSLMPTYNLSGIRREVVEGMKKVPAGVLRFPGGCFASTYRWQDGIGDRDCRPMDFRNWWNIPLINDFGTVEFLTLCRAVGSEPMLCVPVMFGDSENAADWVAFCNTEKHRLHRKAAMTAPIPVKYWELDNETYRRMDAITYAHRCVEFSRAMKKVDPTIKIIMNCYWIYHNKLQEMLEIAGQDIDFVNNRGGSITELRGDLAVLARYNIAHNRHIYLIHSEFRAHSYELSEEDDSAGDTGGLNKPKDSDEKDTFLAKATHWGYGLNAMSDYLAYQAFGGGFQFACFTQYTDGWGENLINISKSRVFPSAAGQALGFLQRQHMAWPLAIESDASSAIRTQAAWDAEKKNLTLFVINLSRHPKTLTFNLSQIKSKFRQTANAECISAPHPSVFNTETRPSRITEESVPLQYDGKTVSHTCKPYSATAIHLVSQP
jgi:alpha-N-arabinofuranosidase